MEKVSINKNVLIALFFAMVLGWAGSLYFGLSVGAAKLRAHDAESAADDWKGKAGKAYTELLVARSKPGEALIPKGTRMECEFTTADKDGHTVATCDKLKFLPPRDY
jgi:hypothetical protein